MAEHPRSTRALNLSVIGSTGLKETGGYIYEEFLPRLRGLNGVKLYTEMAENNAIVGTILHATDLIVRQVDWRVITPKGLEDKPEAIKWKDFIETCMSDMSLTWADFISETLSILVQGWAYFETVYKLRKGDTGNSQTASQYNDGLWGWRKHEIRAQDTLYRWVFDPEDNGLEGMLQLDMYRAIHGGPAFIPITKALLFRTRSVKANPEGKSLLRPAVRSYFFVKRLQEIEAIGIERDLVGLPIAWVPQELLLEDASDDDKALLAKIKDMVQKIRVDERMGAVFPAKVDKEGKPTGWDLTLLSSGGKRMISPDVPIQRYESRIAMVFLAEFIMIGMNKVGTQGADKSKKDLYKTSLETILNDMIASVINQFAVGRLMQLNNVPRELWPSIKPGKISSPDLDGLGSFIESLSKAGVLSPNQELENTLLDKAQLPVPPEEDLEIFTDPNRPTPRDAADQAAGVLSPSQIDSIMSINSAIKDRRITRAAAEELTAAALGMDPGNVGRFLIEEPPEPTQPVINPDVEVESDIEQEEQEDPA